MTFTEASQLTKEQIARAFGVPAHILVDPDRPAAPRTWSLCMTSENHGTVGPAGCTFSHAPEKHERVLVVEVPTAAGAPADQINLRLVGARKDLPVAEFQGYVEGEPLVRWLDRDNMPRVGTKLFAEPVAAQAGQVAVPEDVARDAERYRWLRDRMSFTDSTEPPTMKLRARLPALEHDFHKDWVGDRFDASVDRSIDVAMQASTPGESQEGGAA